jgi:propionyl-CoA carboxylase alpha chain
VKIYKLIMNPFIRFSKRAYRPTKKSYPKTFDKILIANRGEISRRIISTCRKMDIKTVCIYSDADRHSMFVNEADESYRIGPAPTNQSYLCMDKILDVVKKTGAQAVHPGYGFLSENKVFSKLLQDNDVEFIGPPGPAITAMGDKLQSKLLAKKANVSTVPGYLGAIKDEEEVIKISNDIGYPVMIKASAGGGGKGMRIAWNDQEASEGYKLSKQEAKAAFGDDTIIIEKYIEQPRHIEFQLLGDKHGNYVYLPERECSVQRRNQKVIEEAPSTLLDPETRHRMGSQAVSLAAACGYYSTGTTEFLVDKNLGFYFLEMNTRLQVEHPITEEITGVDLVEEMIKIAAGYPLEFTQDDIKIKGHSFEMRVYAEDPARKFLPSIGFLRNYHEPMHHENIRIDTGVEEGSEISMYYDPMISKTITWGETRTEALELLKVALNEYVVQGVTDNVGFGLAICNNEAFASGNYDTYFIPTFYPEGYHGEVLTVHDHYIIAITAAQIKKLRENQQSNVAACTNATDSVFITIDKLDYRVDIVHDGAAYTVGEVGGDTKSTFEMSDFELKYNSLIRFNAKEENETKPYLVQFEGIVNELDYTWKYNGSRIKTRVYDEKQFNVKHHMAPPIVVDYSRVVIAPMPGAIVSVDVKVGETVVDGQGLLVMEAMKMQNLIKSERDGVIRTVKVKTGDSVAVDSILIEFE